MAFVQKSLFEGAKGSLMRIRLSIYVEIQVPSEG